MAPEFVLEIEHPFRQDTAVYLVAPLSPVVLAYLVVLTVNAAHVAVAEEDCPRPEYIMVKAEPVGRPSGDRAKCCVVKILPVSHLKQRQMSGVVHPRSPQPA